MSLLAPIWIVLLVPAALAAWRWPTRDPRLRWFRWAVWILVVLALMQPILAFKRGGGTLVVVSDLSESMPGDAASQQAGWITQLQKNIPDGRKLAVISFRRQAAVERAPQGGAPFRQFRQATGKGGSNLREALDLALDQIPEESEGRVVVISDGLWTGLDPLPAAARAARRHVAIDVHRLARPAINDWRILGLNGPDTIERNQAAIFTAWIEAPTAGKVSYELLRNGQPVSQGSSTLAKGTGRLLFRDIPDGLGVADYRLRITGSDQDPVLENNEARLLVGIQDVKPMLCISPTGHSSLADLFRRSGIVVEERSALQSSLTLAQLGACNGVVLENVPARDVGQAALANIVTWVEEAGGGVLTTGGEQMYGKGGYRHTPLEKILPVSLQLRREHRKESVGIAVVLDRSGSMAMPASDGRPKIALAAEGALEVASMLSPKSQVSIIAVDSSRHVIIPAMPAEDAAKNTKKILGIQSDGGGIFVYEGLKAGYEELLKMAPKNKHLILFADAADAEQTDDPKKDYIRLVETSRKSGISVSVVGLGTEADGDANYLKDIAARGGGRIFFTNRAEELPALFAEETFAITGSGFVQEPRLFRFTPAWLGLGGLALPDPPAPLDGHNVCFPRDGALVAAVTKEQDPDPVLAYWQAGAGRVVSYMGEASGTYGQQFGRWKEAGNFFLPMARWIRPELSELPKGLVARRSLRDGVCTVDLFLADDKGAPPFQENPRVLFLRSRMEAQTPEPVTAQMNWVAPDQLQAELVLDSDETILPVLLLDGKRHPLPAACLPCPPEFSDPGPDKGAPALLRLAEITAGSEAADLSSAWDSLPDGRQEIHLRPACLLLAMLVLLLEILQNRLGWLDGTLFERLRQSVPSLPGIELPKLPKRAPRKQPGPTTATTAEPPPPPPKPETPADEHSTMATLRQARKRADQINKK